MDDFNRIFIEDIIKSVSSPKFIYDSLFELLLSNQNELKGEPKSLLKYFRTEKPTKLIDECCKNSILT